MRRWRTFTILTFHLIYRFLSVGVFHKHKDYINHQTTFYNLLSSFVFVHVFNLEIEENISKILAKLQHIAYILPISMFLVKKVWFMYI